MPTLEKTLRVMVFLAENILTSTYLVKKKALNALKPNLMNMEIRFMAMLFSSQEKKIINLSLF